VQLFFGNFGGIRKKRGFRHRLVYKASRVFEETTLFKGDDFICNMNLWIF